MENIENTENTEITENAKRAQKVEELITQMGFNKEQGKIFRRSMKQSQIEMREEWDREQASGIKPEEKIEYDPINQPF